MLMLLLNAPVITPAAPHRTTVGTSRAGTFYLKEAGAPGKPFIDDG